MEASFIIMKNRNLDLSNHLKKKEKNRQIKPVILISLGLLLILLSHNLPWHWQLFIRWIFRQGDVTEIPKGLYQPLNDLCYTASSNGYVDGYQGSAEIAYSLGKFECRISPQGNSWIVRDIYQFNNIQETKAGWPLSILIVKLLGINYAYKIEASIPKTEINRYKE